MPYNFGEYVSTYVDPQSVKISETLRDRYMQNFQANDQLAMAVDQMQAALPFENDVQRKRELQRELDNKLAMLAEQGDYENLGFAIHKSAKDFGEKYAPIKQNYTNYQTAMQDLQTRLGAEKNGINPEQMKYAPAWMVGDYKGFEIDPETGRVKEGTMFTPKTVYADPKIMDRVTERLKILHEEKTGQTVKKVAQGADGSLTIESGNTISKIDPEKVQEVVDAVMAEPDVKGYVDQLADMKAYAYKKSGNIPQALDAQAVGIQTAMQTLQGQLNGKIDSRTRSAITQQLKALTGELDKVNQAKQDPDNLGYNYIKSKLEDEIVAPVKQYASLKGGIYEQTSTYKEDYDSLWLDEVKRQKDAAEKLGVPMTEVSEVTADTYGKTVEEQLERVKGLEQQAKDLEDQVANDPNMSSIVKQSKLAMAAGYRNQSKLINQNLATAGNMSYSMHELESTDSNIMSVLKDLYPGKTPGEYGVLLQRTFDNPGDQDYIDFVNKWNSKIGQGWKVNVSGGNQEVLESADFNRYLATKYGATGSSETLDEARYHTTGDDRLIQGPDDENRFYDDGLYHYTDVSGGLEKIRTGFAEKVHKNTSAKLSEIKISTPQYSGVMPGLTIQDQKLATDAADKYFKEKTLPTHFQVTNSDGTTMSGADLSHYKVSSYSWNPELNSWTLTMQGDNANTGGAVKTVRLSGEQVNNEALQKFMSSPETKLASTITKFDTGKKGDVREFTLNSLDANGDRDGKFITVKVYSQGAGSPPLIQVLGETTNEKGETIPVVTKKYYPSEIQNPKSEVSELLYVHKNKEGLPTQYAFEF